MRIAVFGAGGVGGYFGARLAAAGEDVTLIARGEHLATIRERGVHVESVRGDIEVVVPATDDPDEVGPVDVVLFCVKSYDTDSAASRLRPLIASSTAVVSLQNGIDNEERITAVVGWPHVVGAAAFIFTSIAAPGVIRHSGGPSRILFGEMDGRASDRAERLLAACTRADIPAEISTDIRVVLWTKYAFICAQAGMTAATRLPIGEIRAIPESREMFRRIVEEVWRVGLAEGVSLPDDMVERQVAFADGLEPDGHSSLHYDLTHGRRMELEALHGELIRRARTHGIEVPACEAVYALLRPWAAKLG
jgi:2-dehydropantoate 2-reductase